MSSQSIRGFSPLGYRGLTLTAAAAERVQRSRSRADARHGQLSIIQLFDPLEVRLSVVVDLGLRSRVQLDVADFTERVEQLLLLLLELHVYVGVARNLYLHAARDGEIQLSIFYQLGGAQGGLHTCGTTKRRGVEMQKVFNANQDW